jgi:hypothetical protein
VQETPAAFWIVAPTGGAQIMAESYHVHGAASSRSYTFSQKWGDDPFTAMGYTQAPNALIEYAARLHLTPEECWLIVCILRFKHTPENPYPSQAKLAALFGQSERTIRRLVDKVEQRGLLSITRVRGDHGHFTHIVYDFSALRAALNACYYEDHPQERPAPRSRPRATGQKCPVDQRPVLSKPPDRIDQTTGQICPPNKSLKEKIEKESSSPAASSEQTSEKTASPPDTPNTPDTLHSGYERFKHSLAAQQFEEWRGRLCVGTGGIVTPPLAPRSHPLPIPLPSGEGCPRNEGGVGSFLRDESLSCPELGINS